MKGANKTMLYSKGVEIYKSWCKKHNKKECKASSFLEFMEWYKSYGCK